MIRQLTGMFFLFCSVSISVSAQVPFTTIDSVDVNNIVATMLVHGDILRSFSSGTEGCIFPRGTRQNRIYPGALWLSGYDAGGQLHVAAQTYRYAGNDYWPGPLDASGSLDYATSYNWAKIWKVNRSDIQGFRSMGIHTTSNTPSMILTWPGKGNVYAQGNGGVTLTITTDMAPFVDLNGNGIYEPLQGEYPDIKGDQALWCVFSDNGPTHTQTNSNPLGVEIHAMSYAYKRGTLIDNVVYYDYTIVNRSSSTYNNCRAGIWSDPGIGSSFNNYVGFDSVHRMAVLYCYYIGSSVGHPGSYVDDPIMGISLVSLPGDVGANYVPAGSFIRYNNDASIMGDPTADTDYYNYMRATLRNGQHFTNDFVGRNIASQCYGSGPDCNYLFTGDPSDTTQWSECNCGNDPGERQCILSSNDFTLIPGGSQHMLMALVAADSAGGCPGISFDSIKTVADTAWAVYANSAEAVSNIAQQTAIIYPNPAHDKLYFDAGSSANEGSINVYNVLGQMMNTPIRKSGNQYVLDISQFPGGFYNLLYRNSTTQQAYKFVKQ